MGACYTESVPLHLGLGRELWSTGCLSGLHLHAFKDYRERNINALVVSMKLKKKNAFVVFHREFWNHIIATKNAFFPWSRLGG